MYKHIVIPVDLNHVELLEKALVTGADLSRHYDAKITLMAVTGTAPSEVAHNPAEFQKKLDDFAALQSRRKGATFEVRTLTSHDLAIDMEKKLDEAIHEMGADLIVMASHVPGFREYIFRSHASYLASHSDISVFVVR